MTHVHPTASVSPSARLDEGVRVGPFAVLEDRVELGAGAMIGAHAVIHAFVRIGSQTHVYPHAVLGGAPQDVSYSGAQTWLEIGDETIIREYVTVHRATTMERSTRIGSNCYLMAYCHVAHDCQIGNRVTLTNGVTLGGHVRIGDRAMLGGLVPVHQFVRIGSCAMVGGNTGLRKDVLPFSLVAGEPARHYRLNTVGLRRAGVTGERYRLLEIAFRALRTSRSLDDVPESPEIALLRAWLATPSKRGLTGFAGRPERQDAR